MTPTLPGGLWQDGSLERAVRLRPVTGRLERRLAELAGTWPEVVSAILVETVEAIGPLPVDEASLDRLCVADRQYLLLWVARQLHGDSFWVTARCDACGARFDLGLQRSALPVKPAGPDFPFAAVVLTGRTVALRVPTGADQRRIATLDDRAALRELVRGCVTAVDGTAPPPDLATTLTPADVAQVELALDAVAPDIGTCVSTRCPDCDAERVLEVDPYADIGATATALFDDVHALASHYHWSEHDILSLTRERRRRYLRLIERTHGVVQ